MSVALIPFVTFAASQVGTPGPANMVLLATGARFGVRRSLPFICGVVLGKQLIIWPLGFGLIAIQDDYPFVFALLKWVSVAYILYLAYHISGMRLSIRDAAENPPGFLSGLIVHPLNPKAWAMVTTGVTTFLNTVSSPLLATTTIAIILLGLQIILHPLWAYVGQTIAASLAGKPAEKYLMWTLAGLTVASVFYALFAGGGVK